MSLTPKRGLAIPLPGKPASPTLTGGGGFSTSLGGGQSGAPGESMRDQMRRQQMERRYITQAGTFVQQAVGNGSTTVTITFDREEADTRYGVVATPTWATTCYVSARTTTSCTLTFGTAAGANATVDVVVFRA